MFTEFMKKHFLTIPTAYNINLKKIFQKHILDHYNISA